MSQGAATERGTEEELGSGDENDCKVESVRLLGGVNRGTTVCVDQ